MCHPAARDSWAADVLPGNGEFLQKILQGSCRSAQTADGCPTWDQRQGGKAARIEWSTPMLEAFEGSKQQRVKATHLAHLGKKARLALSVDALACM